MKIKKSDLIEYFTSREDKNFAQTSINQHKIRLKRFITWHYRDKKVCENDKEPEIVSWIQIAKRFRKTKTIDDVLTPTQIQAMVNSADKLRDKCLVSLGWEYGARISEILDIRIKDININPNYAYVKVDGKTGERTNIIIDSYPHLIKWLENHPYKHDKEHHLFISLAPNYYGNQLFPSTVGSILRTLAKRAGVNTKNRITCHVAFRHSRLTYLTSTLNWNEPKLRKFAGWSPTSNMTDVYCHGTEKDVYDSLKLEAGIIEDKETIEVLKEKEALKPKICPKCSNVNPAGSLYCNCGLCLDYDEAQNIDSKKTKLMDEATNLLMEIMADPVRLEKFMKFKELNS